MIELKAVEIVRHQLSVAVRLDNHFTEEPVTAELEVSLSSREPGVKSSSGSLRHPDGTYRFRDLDPGPRDIKVRVLDDDAFTWTPVTSITLPLADARVPVVIEVWPSPRARAPAGALAVRGHLEAATVAAGQEVQMEVVSGFPPRNKRTRIDADREFLFLVLGPMEQTPDHKIQIDVTIPGRTVTSIDITDGSGTTTFPGSTFDAPPGGEIRAVIKLS